MEQAEAVFRQYFPAKPRAGGGLTGVQFLEARSANDYAQAIGAPQTDNNDDGDDGDDGGGDRDEGEKNDTTAAAAAAAAAVDSSVLNDDTSTSTGSESASSSSAESINSANKDNVATNPPKDEDGEDAHATQTRAKPDRHLEEVSNALDALAGLDLTEFEE